MEAVAMFSADGEKVEFNTQVTLEGPVEVSVKSSSVFLSVSHTRSIVSHDCSVKSFASLAFKLKFRFLSLCSSI